MVNVLYMRHVTNVLSIECNFAVVFTSYKESYKRQDGVQKITLTGDSST